MSIAFFLERLFPTEKKYSGFYRKLLAISNHLLTDTNILMITDRFTHWPEVYPLTDINAFTNFITRFAVVLTIATDQNIPSVQNYLMNIRNL